MSHRWNCPDSYEARREGERAFEYGRSRGSNPYEDTYWNRDSACPEAADEWRSGYRRAEMRAEEEREEEAARHRAEARRAEAQAEEDYYYQQRMEDYGQEQEYYAELEAQADGEAPSVGDRAAVSGEDLPGNASSSSETS